MTGNDIARPVMDERARGVGLEAVPSLAAMLAVARFVVWVWKRIGRKDGTVYWTKVPLIPGTGISLRTNDARGFTYVAARAGVERGEADGVGWVVTGETRWVWLDLDKCRDPETGVIAAWALAVLAMVPGAYHELTPSGTGMRIVGAARLDLPMQGRLMMQAFLAAQDKEGLKAWGGTRECHPRAAIEVYFACARYVTVTGWDAGGSIDVDVGGLAIELWQLGERQAGERRRRRDRGVARAAGPAQASVEDIIGALEVMTNEDVAWDDWVRVGLAVRAAAGERAEECFEAFEKWSEKSEKHVPEACREAWEHWGRSPGDRVGFGTLRWLAREAVEGWKQPSRRPEAEFDIEGWAEEGSRPEAAPKARGRPPGTGVQEAATIAAEQLGRLAAVLIYVLNAHRFLDSERLMLLDESRVNAIAGVARTKGAFMRGQKGLMARLLAHPALRTVDTLTNQPGGPEIVHDEVNELGATVSAVNLWRPSKRTPLAGAGAEEAGLWLEHMRRLLPDDADRERVLNRLGWALRNPGRKMNSALVLLGGQGAGKDVALEPFWQAIGYHNMAVVPGMDIGGNAFNGYLQKAWILISEMPHAHKRSSYEEIKNWLTTPPTHIRINPKGLEAFHIRNIINVIVTTNHAGAIAMAEDDRRFDIIQCSRAATPEEEAAGYYKRLYAWYENGGHEAVAGYLLGRDVSGFNPNAAPPVTAAKEAMRREGAHPAVNWAGALWGPGEPLEDRRLVTVNEILVRGQRGDWGANSTISRNLMPSHITQALRLGGWTILPQQIVDGDKKPFVWARKAAVNLLVDLKPATLARKLQEDRAKSVHDFDEDTGEGSKSS